MILQILLKTHTPIAKQVPMSIKGQLVSVKKSLPKERLVCLLMLLDIGQHSGNDSAGFSTSSNSALSNESSKKRKKAKNNKWVRGKKHRNVAELLKGRFSREEDLLLCDLYESEGSNWNLLALQLGRTPNTVKTRMYSLMRKTAKRVMPKKAANQLSKDELQNYFSLTHRNLKKGRKKMDVGKGRGKKAITFEMKSERGKKKMKREEMDEVRSSRDNGVQETNLNSHGVNEIVINNGNGDNCNENSRIKAILSLNLEIFGSNKSFLQNPQSRTIGENQNHAETKPASIELNRIFYHKNEALRNKHEVEIEVNVNQNGCQMMNNQIRQEQTRLPPLFYPYQGSPFLHNYLPPLFQQLPVLPQFKGPPNKNSNQISQYNETLCIE
eukprot:TRINITY_DN1643_c0_g1_i1.p1 TRINITY_DN1643_c0_g1~~TRINITY_DN1643_c0_g1_i1.p1  ORF type:complete len:383 (-),score=10.72 TRINITY_DN1643_c0_g1_i1:10-1158(-)